MSIRPTDKSLSYWLLELIQIYTNIKLRLFIRQFCVFPQEPFLASAVVCYISKFLLPSGLKYKEQVVDLKTLLGFVLKKKKKKIRSKTSAQDLD